MGTAKILIVEDEGVLAMIVKRKVNDMRYTVTGIARSGEEAIKMAETQPPDLVLMDIKLEGSMDGVEAGGCIRERFDIPVVFLTAFSDEETLRRAKITEPYGYILKPVEDRELKCNIEIALYKHQIKGELQRKKEMEALGKFSLGIAHDFGNLLQCIKGFIELAVTKCPSTCSEGSCIPLLEKSLKHLHKTEDLVKLYQDICKGDPLGKINITLVDIIDKAVKEVETLKKTNLSFHLDLSNTNLPLLGDKDRLVEVFTQLLCNAVEAMAGKDEGNISISAEDITIEQENEWLLNKGSYVKISIHDQGKGISAENIKMLFIPYFSTKDDYTRKGLGLGLTICYSIIKRHEGHIEVKSEEGKGTTVNVFLPASANSIS